MSEYLELQRYGRNKSTLVDSKYISSGEYRKKFDKITNNTELSRLLYSKAKEMLMHRSGTLYEDMYWIDAEKMLPAKNNCRISSESVYRKRK